MIWAKNKAGDDCPGCGAKLVDDPGAYSGRGIGVKWLVHEDTKLTICGIPALLKADNGGSSKPVVIKKTPIKKIPAKKDASIDSIKSAMGKRHEDNP